MRIVWLITKGRQLSPYCIDSSQRSIDYRRLPRKLADRMSASAKRGDRNDSFAWFPVRENTGYFMSLSV